MLNLSGVSMGGNPTTTKRNHHNNANTASSAAAGGGSGNNNNNNNNTATMMMNSMSVNNNTTSNNAGLTTETLFEDEVPVHVRNMEREEVCQDLGICLQVAKNGPYRSVHVRVTDPKDPFFLYTMSLSEDDYGRFKDKNELHVDFAGFPKDLVAMLSSAQSLTASQHQHQQQTQDQHQHHQQFDTSMTSTAAGGPTLLSFVIAESVHGTLRILERTGFRHVEHLSLSLVKQGDVGQKQHLAERFRFFQHAFLTSDSQRRSENDQSSRQISELQSCLEETRAERDGLRQSNAVQQSEHQLALASTSDRLREKYEEQIKSLQAERDSQIANLKQQHKSESDRSQQEQGALTNRLQQATSQIRELENERLRLTQELTQKSEGLAAAHAELQRQSDQIGELSSFKKSAVREKTELDLQAVASSERIKHMGDLVKLRDEENSQLRRQADTNDSALRRANDQLDTTRKKLDETEQSLSKAHHIIATHLQAIKSAKEKQHSLAAQVQHAEKTAQEKSLECERIRMETSADREKAVTLNSRVTELKELLQKAQDENQTLASEVKQSQEALLHLGRQTSSMPNRTWSSSNPISSSSGGAGSYSSSSHQHNTSSTSYSAGGGLSSSSFMPASMTVMRQFAQGAQNTTNNNNAGAGDSSSSSSSSSSNLLGQGHLPPSRFTTTTSTPSSKMTGSASSSSSSSATNMLKNTASLSGGGGSSSIRGGDSVSMLRNTASSYGQATPSPGGQSAYFPS